MGKPIACINGDCIHHVQAFEYAQRARMESKIQIISI